MNPIQKFSKDFFSQRIKTIGKKHVQGTFFRLVLAIHSEAIEETGPSFMVGGRYNLANEFGALYLAKSPELCWQEKLKYYNNMPATIPSQTLGEFQIKINHCLDLTDPKTLKILGITIEDIIQPGNHYLTKMIGSAAWSSGVEAILVPSAINSSQKNIVVFRDHLTSQSTVIRKKIGLYKISLYKK